MPDASVDLVLVAQAAHWFDLPAFYAEVARVLRPGGVLAVWSSGPNPAFTKRLRSARFDVNEVAIRATGKGGGARHVIWIATKA